MYNKKKSARKGFGYSVSCAATDEITELWKMLVRLLLQES